MKLFIFWLQWDKINFKLISSKSRFSICSFINVSSKFILLILFPNKLELFPDVIFSWFCLNTSTKWSIVNSLLLLFNIKFTINNLHRIFSGVDNILSMISLNFNFIVVLNWHNSCKTSKHLLNSSWTEFILWYKNRPILYSLLLNE